MGVGSIGTDDERAWGRVGTNDKQNSQLGALEAFILELSLGVGLGLRCVGLGLRCVGVGLRCRSWGIVFCSIWKAIRVRVSARVRARFGLDLG